MQELNGLIDVPPNVDVDADIDVDDGKDWCDECDPSGVCRVVRKGTFEGREIYCDCEFGKYKQHRKLKQMQYHFKNCGVPKRLHGVNMETARAMYSNEAMQSPTMDCVRDFLNGWSTTDPESGNEREGLCIFGKNGVGKSSLMVIVARRIYRFGLVPFYIKYSDMIENGIQDNFTNEDVHGRIVANVQKDVCKTADVLFVDDLGDPFGNYSKQESKNKRDIFFNIISYRHENMLPTHLTSNYKSLGHLANQFDPRIASRIKEMCATTVFNNVDVRNHC